MLNGYIQSDLAQLPHVYDTYNTDVPDRDTRHQHEGTFHQQSRNRKLLILPARPFRRVCLVSSGCVDRSSIDSVADILRNLQLGLVDQVTLTLLFVRLC